LKKWDALFPPKLLADAGNTVVVIKQNRSQTQSAADKLQKHAKKICRSGKGDVKLGEAAISYVEKVLPWAILRAFGGVFVAVEHLTLARPSQALNILVGMERFSVINQCENPPTPFYWSLDSSRDPLSSIIINSHLLEVPCVAVGKKFVGGLAGASLFEKMVRAELRSLSTRNSLVDDSTTSAVWTKLVVDDALRERNSSVAILRDGIPTCLKDTRVQSPSCHLR